MNKIILRLNVLFKYSFLLKELVIRDIKLKYKRSVLGLVWTVLNPLLMMMVMTLVFSHMFQNSIEYFPIYYMTGNLLFTFNTEATNQSLTCLTDNSSLLKKVYIPKYLFPLSKVLTSLVNLLFSFIALLIVMLVLQVKPHFTLLLFPIVILYQFIFTTGLSLFLSSITVFFRDVIHLYNVVTLAWMYLTPLFYPTDLLPTVMQSIIKFNPMYQYINYFRKLVLYGEVPSLLSNFYCVMISGIMLCVGLFVFYKKQDRFILYM